MSHTRASRLPPRDAAGPALIACLHLLPLPGSPRWGGSLANVRDRAIEEAQVFGSAGVDGLILENTHDIPYLKRDVEAATVAAMALVAGEVRKRHDLPIGIQVLAGANEAALDIAVACDLDFIRAEGFAYGHVADEGWIEADAGRLLRRRAHLGADHIEVWTDIKKKHAAHAVTADLSLREMAEGVLYYGGDGVIVTGTMTGRPASLPELDAIHDLPIRRIVGSGVTAGNIGEYAARAQTLIVGSAFKSGGDWRGPVERGRVEEMVRLLRAL